MKGGEVDVDESNCCCSYCGSVNWSSFIYEKKIKRYHIVYDQR